MKKLWGILEIDGRPTNAEIEVTDETFERVLVAKVHNKHTELILHIQGQEVECLTSDLHITQ